MSSVIHEFAEPTLIRFPTGTVWLVDPAGVHMGPMKHPEGTKIVPIPCVTEFRTWCAENGVSMSLLPSGPMTQLQQIRPDDEHAALAFKLRWI